MLLRCFQCAKHAIKVDGVVAVVVLVGGVVDGMVASAHDGPDLPMDAVVNVGGPDPREEEHDLMGKEVHGAVEEGPRVGDGLQNAVDGVEGQARKGGQRVLLIVLVVVVVQVAVGPLDVMEAAVHPVHTKLDRQHVEHEVQGVHRQPDVLDSRVCHGPALLCCHLSECRQQGVEGHGPVGHLDLLPNVLSCWDVAWLEKHVPKAVVRVVAPEPPNSKINRSAEYPAAEPCLNPVWQLITYIVREHPHYQIVLPFILLF
mmetsp:Transcript_14895/g.32295  ORF Transcript_14895/g.32295 Transcript_14895/m.32295 type:complete len:258 (-) Transcript_14895:351-1124(-)